MLGEELCNDFLVIRFYISVSNEDGSDIKLLTLQICGITIAGTFLVVHRTSHGAIGLAPGPDGRHGACYCPVSRLSPTISTSLTRYTTTMLLHSGLLVHILHINHEIKFTLDIASGQDLKALKAKRILRKVHCTKREALLERIKKGFPRAGTLLALNRNLIIGKIQISQVLGALDNNFRETTQGSRGDGIASKVEVSQDNDAFGMIRVREVETVEKRTDDLGHTLVTEFAIRDVEINESVASCGFGLSAGRNSLALP